MTEFRTLKDLKLKKEVQFKWTDWNCEGCRIYKMLKKRETDGKLLCKKCSKNKSLKMAMKEKINEKTKTD